MDLWNRKIFIALTTLAFYPLNLQGESIAPAPTVELNSLDLVPLTFKIPRIDASNTLSSFVSFDELLIAHVILLPDQAPPLSWEVKNKKKQLPYPLISSEIKIEKFKEEGPRPSPSASAQSTRENYFEKNFFDDLIGNLEKRRQTQDIKALFYPHDQVNNTSVLQDKLHSSLEFKVLTFANNRSFATAVPAAEQATIKTLKLTPPSIKRNPAFLSKHQSPPLEEKMAINRESLTKQKGLSPLCQKQTSQSISLEELVIPQFSTKNSNIYTFLPGVCIENVSFEQNPFICIEKPSMKMHSSSLDIAVTFLPASLIVKKVDQNITPSPIALDNKLLIYPLYIKEHPRNSAALENSHFISHSEQDSTPYFIINSVSPQKHCIEKSTAIYPSYAELNPVDLPPLDKNESIQITPTPLDEITVTSDRIFLSLHLIKNATPHEFIPNDLIPISGDELIEIRTYASVKNSTLVSQKELNELPILLNCECITQSEAPSLSYLEKKLLPKNELINKNTPLSFHIRSVDQKNPIQGALAFYPLNQDENIALAQPTFGRLGENAPAVFSKAIPNYTNETDGIYFFENILSTNDHSTLKRLPLAVNLSLPFKQIHSSQINSNLQPKKVNTKHSFKPAVSAIFFTHQMGILDQALLAKKQATGSTTSVNYSKEEELALISESLKVGPLLQAQTPYQSKNVSLQNELSINKAEFKGDITLPKLLTINDENSFFLNPMLSLIDSTAFAEDYTQFGEPSIVNRNNRMTQSWLFNQPSLVELNTDSLPEAFNIETRLLSGDALTDNDFACILKTSEKNVFDPLPVHILYILDTSTSIEPHRFKTFKEAIISSLDQLDSSSTFNIAIFSRGKVEMLHEKNPHPTTSSKGYAKRYLKKVTQTAQTSFKDLISLLEREKTLASEEFTHRSCLILSDGKFASNIRIDRKSLDSLSKIDAGNFSIYTASVSDSNNNAMLSLLAKLNHGFSLYTRTHASFSRKFSTLLKHIKHPLIHDVMISFPDDDGALAYISDQVSPVLLADKEFTFYGHSKEKKRSRVFIQGRSGNRWVNILKELPLDSARKGRAPLKKKLVGQKSVLSLQSFVDTKDESYLLKAQELGFEYNLSLPVP